MSQRTVLVVEDEPAILLGLEDQLRSEGYRVVTATDGEQALERAASEHPHLVLLDIMLPKLDGLEVCRRMRLKWPHLPIIMLTAKSQEIDKVLGLEMGADDYITKPFSVRELLARIKAVLRRSEPVERPLTHATFADVQVDFEAYVLRKRGRATPLSPLEARMLRYFMENEGRVISRDEFLTKVWGYEHNPVTRTVDFHVLRLRQKVEDDPNEPAHITTVHGLGYKFVASP
ncbi:MAG: response regulator transcription factor [Planctomycetota bacterium]